MTHAPGPVRREHLPDPGRPVTDVSRPTPGALHQGRACLKIERTAQGAIPCPPPRAPARTPRRRPGCAALALTLLLAAAAPLPGADLVLKDAPAHVYFSPNGGAQAALTAAIAQARQTILVQAYSFTSAPIAGALKAAHDRGVAVRVILDKSQRTERTSGLTYLVHAGIPTWIDAAYPIAHDKVMVIDGRVVVTGSFNFTRAAEEKNGENLLIVESPALAELYARNWQAKLSRSEPVD